MASKRAATPAKHLFNTFRPSISSTSRPCLLRSMATEAHSSQTIITDAPPTAPPATDTTISEISLNSSASLKSTMTSNGTQRPPIILPQSSLDGTLQHARPFIPQPNPFLTTTQCTLHLFPSMEPVGMTTYPSTHLGVPLRKDILHRAVIYEGDNKRSGTANTKYRSEVHGSNRKVRPQKGTGKARLGNKKSPMLRGGGVAHGPKPRDFGTELQTKVYDLAFRMALSHRYRQGELIVLENQATVENVHPDSRERFLGEMMRHNRFGKGHGGSLFVVEELEEGFETLRHGRMEDVHDVDVKALLELGRVVIERSALDLILSWHQSDLDKSLRMA